MMNSNVDAHEEEEEEEEEAETEEMDRVSESRHDVSHLLFSESRAIFTRSVGALESVTGQDFTIVSGLRN